MRIKRFVITGICLLYATIGFSQTKNSNWKKDLETSLYQFMLCDDPLDDISPCNIFVGESLKVVYQIDDFFSEEKQRYLLANEIFDFLSDSNAWTLLGKGDSQEALIEAQGYANLGKAIVAVMKSETGSGHVALVLPGELGYSGNWGLNVPNSASFFLKNPNKSYIGKKLSFAFPSTDKGQVYLYGRNY